MTQLIQSKGAAFIDWDHCIALPKSPDLPKLKDIVIGEFPQAINFNPKPIECLVLKNWEQGIQKELKSCGIDVSLEKANQIAFKHAKRLWSLVRRHGCKTRPEVMEAIKLLLKAKIPIAIVTSSGKGSLELKISSLAPEDKKIIDQIKTRVTSNDVKNTKPHKEPIERAAEELSVALTPKCLMIGDSHYSDAGAATAAGITSLINPNNNGLCVAKFPNGKVTYFSDRNLLPKIVAKHFEIPANQDDFTP